MSLQMSHVCFILCWQANLIEENVSGQLENRFARCFAVHGWIEQFVEICTVLEENRL